MRKLNKKIAIIAVVALALNFAIAVPKSQAASLTSVSDTVSTMKANTAANHTIVFTTPTGVSAGQTITLTFDAGYDVTTTAGVVVGDVTATATSGTFTITSVVGQVITITEATAVSAGAVITIKVGTNAGGTHQIKNGAAGANKVISIAGTFADSGKIATAFITNDVVAVDANVDPILSFSLSTNTIHFGTITTGSVQYATVAAGGSTSVPGAGNPVQITVGTNAASGVTIAAKSLNSNSTAGLYSANGTTHTIPAAVSSAVTAGTEGYGVYLKNASNLTIDPGFDNNAAGDLAISTAAQTVASATAPVATGTADIVFNAAIASNTMAGAYSSNLTVIATGNF